MGSSDIAGKFVPEFVAAVSNIRSPTITSLITSPITSLITSPITSRVG